MAAARRLARGPALHTLESAAGTAVSLARLLMDAGRVPQSETSCNADCSNQGWGSLRNASQWDHGAVICEESRNGGGTVLTRMPEKQENDFFAKKMHKRYVHSVGMEVGRGTTYYSNRSAGLYGIICKDQYNGNFPNSSWNVRMAMGGVRMHMGHSHGDHSDSFSELGRKGDHSGWKHEKQAGEAGERIMRIGLASDIFLTVGKGAAGWLSGSTAIIADAAHSVSDIVLSGVSLWSVKAARAPSNKTFPFGHGKIETVGALGVALLLIGTGGGIAWHAVEVLQMLLPEAGHMAGQIAGSFGIELGHGGHHDHSHSHSHGLDMENIGIALTAAVVSIGVKEGLYWATKAVGERYGSQLLKANAWHHRSDAISSLVALVGIGGAAVGLPLLDPMAAILVAGMILRAGTSIASQSLRELVDVGLPERLLDPIRSTVQGISGVRDCLYLRGRKMGSSIHVDIHIAVDPRLSVSAAHNIGEAVRRALQDAYPLVTEITVHIDPADGRPLYTPQGVAEHHHDNHPAEKLNTFSPEHQHHHVMQRDTHLNVHGSSRSDSGADRASETEWSETEESEVCGGEVGVMQQSDMEERVQRALKEDFGEGVEIVHMTCHFLQQGAAVELNVAMDSSLTVRQAMELAQKVRASLQGKLPDLVEVDVQLDLLTLSR